MFIQKLQAHDREHALEKATPLRLNFQNQIDDFLSDHSEFESEDKKKGYTYWEQEFPKELSHSHFVDDPESFTFIKHSG